MFDVSVIVFSYNRPRMLREALASIVGARQVIVVDDGSDFDIEDVCRGFPFEELLVLTDSKMTVEERMTVPRFGKNVNKALSFVSQSYVTYLCDDDLFHASWPKQIETFFRANPKVQFIRGLWMVFEDGQPRDDTKRCPLDRRQMTAGNFAHRISMPLRWDENSVTHHDAWLLRSLRSTIDLMAVPCTETIAGYRREHSKTTLRVTPKGQYNDAARELLSGGFLE